MKMTIEATRQMTKVAIPGTVNGEHIEAVEIEARVWEGVTDMGVRCLLFVPLIIVPENGVADQREFEKELKQRLPVAQATPVTALRFGRVK